MRNHLASAGAVLVLAFLSLYSQSSLAQACEQKYFSCKVGGKEVTLCGADLGDSFNIMFSIGTETLAEFTGHESHRSAVSDIRHPMLNLQASFEIP